MMLDYKNDITEGIKRAICHYGEVNNKYSHDFDETEEITLSILILTINADGATAYL